MNQITEVQSPDVFLKDVAEVFCPDPALQNKCRSLKIKTIHETKETRFVEDTMEVIQKISQLDSKAQVSNLGEIDFIIDYLPPKPPRHLWQWTKAAAVCIIAFCGAAFAIMTFNNDVDVPALFKELYRLIMGYEPEGVTILELSYSAGLSLGILIFFNHFAKWQLTKDPTPLEVEMRTYEDEICRTLIQNKGRKEKEVDVT
ncbi:MAG: stage V sporulation protein AA [Lachnospiraceae bacterium]|nr:stage V sporulation protein AA [Lachnospiraceae bacterium]